MSPVFIRNTSSVVRSKRPRFFMGALQRPHVRRFPTSSSVPDLLRETSYNVEELEIYLAENMPKLLPEQRAAFDAIVDSVRYQTGGIFFLGALGSTGKTFVTKLILAELRRTGDIALAVASSGSAATLLSGGKTAHSAFKLPLDLVKENTPICNISKNSDKAEVVRRCRAIVWDECTMSHKGAVEALDRLLRDIKDSDRPMGGITLSGDFKQTLPVIPKGNRADVVRACLKSSTLWSQVRTLSLSTNMRAHLRGNTAYSDFSQRLLVLGEGRLPSDDNGMVSIESVCTVVQTASQLVNCVFPNLESNFRNMEWLSQRAILAPKNRTVDAINDELLQQIPSEERVYKSIDRTPDPEDVIDYPIELLNSLQPPGLPLHVLKLKVGVPIMPLRNLVPPKQCNGTRLVVKSLSPNLIEATLITACGRGEGVMNPRMHLYPSGADIPFTFRRSQFPVRVCFAMSINKAQGQTLSVSGLHLG